MNTTVISGRLVRNPGYNEVENEKGLHKIAKFVLAVRRNYSDEVSFIPVKAFAKKAEFARDYLMQGTKVMVEGEIVTGNYEDKDMVPVILLYRSILHSHRNSTQKIPCFLQWNVQGMKS